MQRKNFGLVMLVLLLTGSAFHAKAATKHNRNAGVTFTILHKFNYKDGAFPEGRPLIDQSGNVFGVANGGGPLNCDGNGCGLVWELETVGSKYTYKILYEFTASNGDGCFPVGSLTKDKDGNLYGTTISCGAGYGTIFKLLRSKGAYTESVLHSFVANEGHSPYGPVVLDKSGNIYGTTLDGGTGCATCGTVWQLSAGQLTTLVNLDMNTTGIEPFNGLAMDNAGNLWGANSEGGPPEHENGTIFELSKSSGSWKFKRIHAFGVQPDGAHPWYETPIFDKAGRVFVTTTFGGRASNGGDGTVMELKNSGGNWKIVTLHSFNKQNGDGRAPYGGLGFSKAGNLVGATVVGGSNSKGIVFELTPRSGEWVETVLHTFGGNEGSGPFYGVSTDAAGNIYGVNDDGGPKKATNGIVFKISGAK
jgi:uncharacterized repeat protein (TIGR03803 family)